MTVTDSDQTSPTYSWLSPLPFPSFILWPHFGFLILLSHGFSPGFSFFVLVLGWSYTWPLTLLALIASTEPKLAQPIDIKTTLRGGVPHASLTADDWPRKRQLVVIYNAYYLAFGHTINLFKSKLPYKPVSTSICHSVSSPSTSITVIPSLPPPIGFSYYFPQLHLDHRLHSTHVAPRCGGGLLEPFTPPPCPLSPSRLDFYCERQARSFCGVHALNALLGGPVLTGPQLVTFLLDVWPQGQGLAYTDHGDFAIECLNLWLSHFAPSPATLVHACSTLQGPCTQASILATCPPQCQALFLWFKHGGTTNHFKCLKLHRPTHTWYSLDSLDYTRTATMPPFLSPQWNSLHTLQAEIYFLAAVDARASGQIGYCPHPTHPLPVDKTTLRLSTLTSHDFSGSLATPPPKRPPLPLGPAPTHTPRPTSRFPPALPSPKPNPPAYPSLPQLTQRPRGPPSRLSPPTFPLQPNSASPPRPTPPLGSIKILTWNIEGSSHNAAELSQLLTQHQPDVLILTETKLTKSRPSPVWLTRLLSRYTLFYSSAPATARASIRSHGGVLVAINHRLTLPGTFTHHSLHPHLDGHLAIVSLHPPSSSPLHVIGVYFPCHNPSLTTQLIAQIDTHLHTTSQDLTLLSGDWNAPPPSLSRHPLRPLVHAHTLKYCAPLHPTLQSTHHCRGQGTHRTLDYTLYSCPPFCSPRGTGLLLPHSGTSDHHPTLTTLSLQDYRFHPPPPTPSLPPPKPRFIYPCPLPALETFRSCMLERLGPLLTQLYTLTKSTATSLQRLWQIHPQYDALQQALTPHLQAQHATATSLLQTITTEMERIAHECLPTYTVQPHTDHPYMPRRFQRALGFKIRQATHLHSAITMVQESLQNHTLPSLPLRLKTHFNMHCTPSLLRSFETQHPFPSPLTRTNWLQWLTQCQQHHRHVLHEKRTLKRQFQRAHLTHTIRHFRSSLSKRPRVMHKKIFSDSSHPPPRPLQAIKDPFTQALHTEPSSIKRIVHSFYSTLQSPSQPTAIQPSPIPYPFSHSTSVDRFPLQPHTPISSADVTSQLTNRLLHGDLCAQHLARLSNNRAPGPDGIINELLKHSPPIFKDSLHYYFIAVWFTHTQPWTNSNTILLHKKQDPLDLNNYRPIGLTNTLYKLWTSILTDLFSQFAESHQIFSAHQEGFRPLRNTIRQLQMVVNILEDARLHNQDIYTLWIDFSSAFNSVPHAHLYQIMSDMGFPDICIANVRGLYNKASTAILTPYGPTPPIPLRRGTLQGDGLSPFLFLVFIEPLLRWLQSGGRGYRFGCLPGPHRQLHSCSHLAYADDLQCLTHSSKDLQIQADKITSFCDWAGMAVNPSKCGTSGIRYQASSHQATNPISPSEVKTTQARLQSLHIQGSPICFHHPHTDPYPYLGVPLTLTLNYKFYYEQLLSRAKQQLQQLNTSSASPMQRLRIIQQKILPAITYAFPIMPLAVHDIDRLDQLLVRGTKNALYLKRYFPNGLVHLAQQHGGIGLVSLRLHYCQLIANNLIKALNDLGTLGRTTRSLFTEQLQALQGLSVSDIRTEAPFLHLAKQYELLRANKLDLTNLSNQLHDYQTEIVTALRSVHYAPASNGVTTPIPSTTYAPLIQLGITTLADLTEDHGRYLIDTATLRQRFGRRVRDFHKRALTRLTHYLHAPNPDGIPPQPDSTRPLPKPQRLIQRPHLITELRTGTLPYTSPVQNLLSSSACHNSPAATPTKPLPVCVGTPIAPLTLPGLPPSRWLCTPLRETHPAYAVTSPRPDLSSARPPDCPPHLANFRSHLHQYFPSSCPRRRLSRRPPPQRLTRRFFIWRSRQAKILHTLYDDTPAKFKRRRVNKRHKLEIQVKWHPILVLKHHLPLFRKHGYLPKYCSPIPRSWVGSGPARHLLLVRWHSTWESAECLKESSLYHALWKDLKTRPSVALSNTQAPPAAPKPFPTLHPYIPPFAAASAWTYEPRTDLRLPSHHRVGHGREPPPPSPQPASITKYLHMFLNPVNPDKDILPQHKYGLYRTPSISPDSNERFCHSYDPGGRYLGTLTCARLRHLYHQYTACPPSSTNQGFAYHVGLLLQRYPPSTLRNHWTVPASHFCALQRSFRTTPEYPLIERMTSPLNVQYNTPQYYSLHPADAYFNAIHDAYSHPWTGLSECNPEYESESMIKALRWAIGSAHLYPSLPTLTLLILPDWISSGVAFQQWLAHPLVQDTITLSRRYFQFQTPHYWSSNQQFAGHPKWNILFVVVANSCGLDTFYTPGLLQHHLTQATTTANWNPDSHNIFLHTNPFPPAARFRASQDFRPPKRLQAIAWPLPSPPDTPLPTQPTPPHKAPPPVLAMPAHQWMPTTIIYTDGSCQQIGTRTCLGAAAYRSPSTEHLIQPQGHGPTTTITRAELVAILHALHHVCQPQNETIASDSLCALYLIQKVIHRPSRLLHSKHGPLLTHIAELLATRARAGYHTTLIKVPAHTGILGNEHADRLARLACHTPPGTPLLFTVDIGNAPYQHKFWLTTTAQSPFTNPPEPRVRLPVLVRNLTSHLKEIAYHTQPIGGANFGVTTRLMLATMRMSLHRPSNALWKIHSQSRLPYNVVKTALQIRGYTLWTAKLANKFKRPYFTFPYQPGRHPCPLCGLPDSQGHILGQCPVLEPIYVQRHDRTARLLIKAIQRGVHGGFHLIADVGTYSALRAMDVLHKRLPSWVLPGPPATRFDIVLVHTPACRTPPQHPLPAGTRITAVELGFCHDYDLEGDTLAAKRAQHAHTCDRLRARGYQLDYQIWTIGHTGILPTKLAGYAATLGIQNFDKLADKIHCLAVEHAYSCVHKRRTLERTYIDPKHTTWYPP